eukprot:2894013-Pleurochrysis_carterae.AAC.1
MSSCASRRLVSMSKTKLLRTQAGRFYPKALKDGPVAAAVRPAAFAQKESRAKRPLPRGNGLAAP